VVRTEGAGGGRYETAEGATGRYDAAAAPGPVVDSYGAGDSFAAGLTIGLAGGEDIDTSLSMAARHGAEALTRRGAHGEP
jgi:ribokinase